MNYEDVRRLHLDQLRTGLQVRLLQQVRFVDAAGKGVAAPAAPATSPFFFAAGTSELIVASKTTAELADAQSELAAALSVAQTATSSQMRVVNPGIRVQLFFPETLFSMLYTDAEPKQSYIDYRNQIYLTVATQLQARAAQLLEALGALVKSTPQLDFTRLSAYTTSVRRAGASGIGGQLGRVGLLGQQMAERGIMGLEIDLPQIVGIDTAALRLVRDTAWYAQLPLKGAGSLTDFLQTAMNADHVAAAAQAWALSGQPEQSGSILPGFNDQPRTVQLRLRAALTAGADVTILDRQHGMWLVKNGAHTGLIAGQNSSLNSAAAVALTDDATARKALLGAAKLPVPAGMSYTDLAVAQRDFARSFAHKSLAVKGPRLGQTTLFPIPATAAAFTNAISARLTQCGQADVEMFVPGDQFNLLVLDGKVCAVSMRDFAYVVGDGRASLEQLVQRRNAQRTNAGLPTINLTAVAKQDLDDQGVNAATIVNRGGQVYLGRDSLAAAAGSWQDGRELLDATYDQLAIAAAKTLNLRLGSVQLVVANGYVPYTSGAQTHGGQLATIVGVDARPDLSEYERPTYGVGVPVLDQVLAAEAQQE